MPRNNQTLLFFIVGVVVGAIIVLIFWFSWTYECPVPTEVELKLQEFELGRAVLRQDYCFNICENLKYGFCKEETEGAYQNCLDNCL